MYIYMYIYIYIYVYTSIYNHNLLQASRWHAALAQRRADAVEEEYESAVRKARATQSQNALVPTRNADLLLAGQGVYLC